MRDLVVHDPDIGHGLATIRGTGVTVSVILDSLAAEVTVEEILEGYPALAGDGIRAAIAH